VHFKDIQMSDLMDDKTDKQLLDSMIAEVAKARNEVACARRDINKAEGRMGFLVVLANKLINRNKD